MRAADNLRAGATRLRDALRRVDPSIAERIYIQSSMHRCDVTIYYSHGPAMAKLYAQNNRDLRIEQAILGVESGATWLRETAKNFACMVSIVEYALEDSRPDRHHNSREALHVVG